jgi:hypothetical protein
MSEYAYIPDHEERALADLKSNKRHKPNFAVFARSFGKATQLLEDTIADLVSSWNIDTALGKNLDLLGALVGERREGLNDDNYRNFIRARILANRSQSNADAFVEVMRLLVAPTSIRWQPLYPRGFQIFFTVSTPIEPKVRKKIQRVINSMRPTGRTIVIGYAVGEFFQYEQLDLPLMELLYND